MIAEAAVDVGGEAPHYWSSLGRKWITLNPKLRRGWKRQ